MRQADVFVLASLAEPCGLALAEARAVGLPIIATAVGGNPELLDGGTIGVLVPPNHPAALARALAQVLLDDEFRVRLGQAAAANLGLLRIERMMADTVAVYRKVLAARG
jgi:glycosyltransferase involved in cell wall biosynthesis